MRRLLSVLLATVAVLVIVLTGTAQASYFIDQGTAQRHVRSHFHYDVGYHHTAASCRPQGRRAPEPGYIYHRWACGFLAGDNGYAPPSCRGQILITGSSHSGRYYYRVLWHEGPCPRGV